MAAQLQQIVLFDTAKADWRDIPTVIANLQNCKVAKLQNRKPLSCYLIRDHCKPLQNPTVFDEN